MNFLAIVFSYLVGNFPSAYLAGRWFKGVDIRTIGDTNPGAANVSRNISRLGGLVVLGLDAAKGIVVVLATQVFVSHTVVLACGIAVIVGHDFPVLFRFKGGRGLAATIWRCRSRQV
jgi:acyl phosphate:glycerol-3-phosphate acyltransferase